MTPRDVIEKMRPGISREEIDEVMRALPAALAAYADEAEAKLTAMDLGRELPKRCASCAFTAGTVPNTRAPATGLDALKYVVQDHPFGCHHDKGPDGLPTRLCAGFLMIMAAETGPKLTAAPWSFSDEIPTTRAQATFAAKDMAAVKPCTGEGVNA